MTTARSAFQREIGLALAHASCSSPAALDGAVDHLEAALRALKEIRAESAPTRRVKAVDASLGGY